MKDRGCSQLRSEYSPSSLSISTRSEVQTSFAATSRWMKSSADARTPNVTWSTRSSAGSKATTTSSSSGGMWGTIGRESRPPASACRWAPPGPNRPSTSSAGSAANSPERGDAESTQQGDERGVVDEAYGQVGQEPADSPSGTTRTRLVLVAVRAACSAVNGPSAITDPGYRERRVRRAARSGRVLPVSRPRSSEPAHGSGWRRCPVARAALPA